MDHLPYVPEPYQPIEVPYLGGRYDGLDFAGYPFRQRWNVDALLAGDFHGRTGVEAGQFLQTWLYFGMICETLAFGEGDQIPWDQFVCWNRSSQGIISTRPLPDLLTRLIARLRVAKLRNEHAEYFERFRKSMDLACMVWKSLLGENASGTVRDLLCPEILLSIQILGATLDIGITEVCKMSPDNFEYTWRTVPCSNFLVKRMIGQGWCPSVVEQLSSPCMTFLYYVSLLGPPSPVDHRQCEAKSRSCSGKTVDAGNYKINHVLESCNCNHVSIPTGEGSKLANAIQDGNIPVIHLTHDGPDISLDIDIHSLSKPRIYTAISHVWSDGLGNPNDNSMPYCQLQRLSRMICALPLELESAEQNSTIPQPSTEQLDCYFWIDTLCVPVTNQLLRNKAIEKMRDVYSSASNVLVLDAELMKSSANRSFDEIYTRIYCSTWIRRLWTLQEAILNKNVLFQFAERALGVDASSRLRRAQLLEITRNPWNLVAWQCQGTAESLLFSKFRHNPQADYMEQISLLWYALACRSTSRVGDEPLCISILHDLDIAEFQREPYASTVRKFWSLLVKGFPAYVMFLPGPKLRDDGYRWALASLLDLQIMGRDFSRAELTSQGLLSTWPGMILGQPQSPTRSVITCHVGGDTYYIRQTLKNDNPSWESLKEEGFELEKCTSLAVIINPILGFREATAGGTYGFESAIGVLVDTIAYGDIMYVKYLRFVVVIRKGSYADRSPNFPWTHVESAEKARSPIEGRFLPKRQRWCVG